MKRAFVLLTLLLWEPTLASDPIPEDLSKWTERGVVLSSDTRIAWENKSAISVVGVAKRGGTYYLYYLAGFDGCWNSDGDVNHQSLGLATSNDGVTFRRSAANPLLIPHDFVPVNAHEEGVRTAYIRYLPQKGKFYGFFGVESPGGKQSCDPAASTGCACNVGVDAQVFLGTSDNGIKWTIDGPVEGAYAEKGDEVYPLSWVYDGNVFGLFVVTAQGGNAHSASKGS